VLARNIIYFVSYPAECGIDDGVWPQRGWDYLKRLEQSLQVPRLRHRKGELEAQTAFKKTS